MLFLRLALSLPLVLLATVASAQRAQPAAPPGLPSGQGSGLPPGLGLFDDKPTPDHLRLYGECMALARKDPLKALPVAEKWHGEGGGLPARHCVATAMFEAGRYPQALALYQQAAALPGGLQLRVLNGLYLANQALEREPQAEAAFGQLVGFGLSQGRLAVKFLFAPGSAAFWPDPAISGAYPMWLRQVAEATEHSGQCLKLVGHASPSGSPAANQRLSALRARRVASLLARDNPGLRGKLRAEGVGARSPIIGTGADNATDVLDRRVEFEPYACPRV